MRKPACTTPARAPVDVYWNLHKKTFSIRSRAQPTYFRVVAHNDRVLLHNVHFVVNQKGREETLRSGHKNVHAFVRGEMDGNTSLILPIKRLLELPKATYNPYRAGHFHPPGQPEMVLLDSPVAVLFKFNGRPQVALFGKEEFQKGAATCPENGSSFPIPTTAV